MFITLTLESFWPASSWTQMPLHLVVGLLLAWGAIGWLTGLALNRVIHQVPRGLQMSSRSACAECQSPIPTLGWGNRCRECGAPLHFDRAEWVTGLLFFGLAFRFGLSGETAAYSIYTAILVAVTYMDLRHRYIYTIVSFPGMIVAMILTPALTEVSLLAMLGGVGAALAILGIFYGGGRLLYRGTEPVGKGDIELAALIGAMVGFPRLINALFLGSLANAIIIVCLLLARRRGRHDFIPYGPGLCVGAFAAFFMPHTW